MNDQGTPTLQDLIEQRIPDEGGAHLSRLLGSALPRAGEPPRYDVLACGRFHGSQFPDLMGYVGAKSSSGALVLVDGDAERVLYLANGVVIGATSTVLFERLGRLLYNAEVVTKEDSGTLVDAEELHGVEALMMWLSAHQLHWAVERRVWEVGAALTLVKRGQFLFVGGEPALEGPRVSIAPEDVAQEGLRLQRGMGSGTPSGAEALEPTRMAPPPPPVQRALKPIDVSTETIREIVKRIREAEAGAELPR